MEDIMEENPGTLSIKKLLENIDDGNYVIPYFQRDFEWNARDVCDLFESILMNYYSGLILLWDLNPEQAKEEKWDSVWGSEKIKDSPGKAILDGQQRLASLYYAIYNPKTIFPNRKSYYVFSLNLIKLLNEDYDGAVEYKCYSSYRSFKDMKEREKDIASKLKTPKKEDKKREVLSAFDIKKIEVYIKNRTEKFKHENLRDRIIFYLGIKCGLRKSEIIKLNWEDMDFTNSELKIIGSKGGNDRVVYFNGVLKKLLLEYKLTKGLYSGGLIRGKNGNRICSNSLQKAIRRAYKESGVYRPGLTLHSLRHTYAESLRKQGYDFSIIQALLGHKSLETTAKYIHVTREDWK